jgi:hypothetical protein
MGEKKRGGSREEYRKVNEKEGRKSRREDRG